jgi:hypothetical protein
VRCGNVGTIQTRLHGALAELRRNSRETAEKPERRVAAVRCVRTTASKIRRLRESGSTRPGTRISYPLFATAEPRGFLEMLQLKAGLRQSHHEVELAIGRPVTRHVEILLLNRHEDLFR